MGRINGFITKSSPSSPSIAKPAFQNILVMLNIPGSNLLAYSEKVAVPAGTTNITIQFFHTIANTTADPTTITVEQSADGENFSPVYSIDSEPFVIGSGSPHTTINIIGVLSAFIRFKFETIPGSYGSINACNVLFA